LKEFVMFVTASILPITSTNFYLFFIAFIVVFFLLGYLIGYTINPRRKLRKVKEKPLAETVKDTPAISAPTRPTPTRPAPTIPNDLGQDIPGNEEMSIQNPNNASGRYNNYNNNNYNPNNYNSNNNYWGYIKPPKQY
jgi:hypothetical protein